MQMPKLLTTKMIQHSRSTQKQTCRNAILNKGFDAESLSIPTTLSGVFRMLGYLLLARCETVGRCSRDPWVPRNPSWKSLL